MAENSGASRHLHMTPEIEPYSYKAFQPSPYSNKVIVQSHDDNRMGSQHRVSYVGSSHYRNASSGEQVIQSTSRSQFVTLEQLNQGGQAKNMSSSTIMK